MLEMDYVWDTMNIKNIDRNQKSRAAGNKKSDTWEVRTLAGEPIALAGQRLNHSAKVSATISFRPVATLKDRIDP